MKKYILLTVAFGAACLTGCSNITDEQIQQAKDFGDLAHDAYHIISGEPCVFGQNQEVIVVSGDEK